MQLDDDEPRGTDLFAFEDEPLSPTSMTMVRDGIRSRNEKAPSDDTQTGGGTEPSAKVPEEVRGEVAPDAEKQMELILQKKAENDRLRKIRRQNASEVMDHVCNNVLDLGSYEKGDHPFTRFLKEQEISDVLILAKIEDSDFESLGYVPTYAVAKKLRYLRQWMKLNLAGGSNHFLTLMGLTHEVFAEFMMSSVLPEPPQVPTKPAEVDVSQIPPAGLQSNRASLVNARRKSAISFKDDVTGISPNVTTQRGSKPTYASVAGSGAPTTPIRPGILKSPGRDDDEHDPPSKGGRGPTRPNPTPTPGGGAGGMGGGSGGGGDGGPPHGSAVLDGDGNRIVYIPYKPPSAASNFDKGGRRSVADYEKFSNREHWSKWQRSTIGTAYEHKCENILDPKFTPDPHDEDAVQLFASQQRFMYSVFSKVLIEAKSAQILREYSTLGKPNFGDAQSLYSDLCDHFEGGAQARVSAASLETQLTMLRLNRQWTKTVTAFVNKVSHVIRDHKEATHDIHDDAYYIEKINTTFSEHKDMAAHIQTLETQDAMITRRWGTAIEPRTYESQLYEIQEYATLLDDRYKTHQSQKRAANAASQNNTSNNGKSGGNGKKKNTTDATKKKGGNKLAGPKYIQPEKWDAMSSEEQQKIRDERDKARSRSANTTNVTNQNAGDASTVGGPPTTIQLQTNTTATQQNAQPAQPGTVFREMITNSTNVATNAASQQPDTLSMNGTIYRRANVTYRISNHGGDSPKGSLVDGGANGGVNGEDTRVLEYVPNASVDLTGVNQAHVPDLKICTSAAFAETANDGPVILIMPQYAHLGKGPTIHSKAQLHHFGSIVDDTPRQAGGRQCLITPDGYVLPIHIRDGLPRIDMRPPTDAEMDQYPHVFLTSDSQWDPTVLDNEYEEEYFDALLDDPAVQQRRDDRDSRVDDHGFLRSRADYEILFRAQDAFIASNAHLGSATPPTEPIFYDAHTTAVQILDPTGQKYDPSYAFDFEPEPTRLERATNTLLSIFPNRLRRRFPHLDALKPYFGWASNERLKTMLEKTTQHYRQVVHYPFRKHFKSRFPAANVPRRNEWVAMDTFFCDTPAADDGIPGHANATMLQFFVGINSGYVSGYPMTSEKQIPDTIEETIRKIGAPLGLMSDQAKAELHGRTKQLLKLYEINDRQSEAEYQHQNPAERKVQVVKKHMNSVMDRTGCPTKWWLLAAIFTLMVMNVLPNSNGDIPYSVVTGQTADISKFLHFHFWQEVFVESHKPGKKEELARWCYPADNVGDELTWWVLLEDSNSLVTRSNVRAARDPLFPNLRERPKIDDLRIPTQAPAPSGEMESPTLPPERGLSGPLYNMQDRFDVPVTLPRFSPEDLLGLTFLHQLPDGQTVRAEIVKKIHDLDAENHQRIKMLVSYDDGKVEEVLSYNELSDLVAEQHDREATGEIEIFSFRDISDHQGPIRPQDPNYKGSSYNVLVQWEDGTETWEPLALMIASDPATLAAYARTHDMLDTPGWKKLKRIARRAHVLQRMVSASKRAQRFNAITYKFGVRIPRNVKEAIRLDEENGNTYWQDAMDRELLQLDEYKVYHSIGKSTRVPTGYQMIPLRMVFDIKQNLTRKARLVARGDKTEPPADSVYSGVASLRSLRMVVFLAELNGLEITGGDIGNAYLEAYTKEKVCFRAGPEFGPREGEIMIIDKALYGLRTSGARFHAKFADTLRQLGFTPTYADPDVWIRDAGDCYEYVVVYVDDILTALKEPKKFYDALRSDPWNYKLKNVEEPKYHLGGDFFRDKDGTYCYGSQTYVKRLVDNYKLMFGELPKEWHAPMEKSDQPELDDSDVLGPDGLQQYQSLLGAVQWTISLCRFDVAHAVMSLGRFRAAPRVGHLERLKRLVGYLRKRPHAAIRFRTDVPSFEKVFGHERVRYEWMETVYGCPPEAIDANAPVPKGKKVRTASFADANLMHDTVTGRSASGIFEMLNQTPIDWFAKRQNQVETATYGSEFMVARQAVERLIDIRYTLRSFGVPLDGEAWLFGDNKSVVTSSTIPHSTLSKRWNALSYHKVREAVAGGWLRFEHIPGPDNPADIFTKPLPWHLLKVFVEPLLMWKGSLADYNSAAKSPPGHSHPEGSVTDPGLGTTQDSTMTYDDSAVRAQTTDGSDGAPRLNAVDGMRGVLANNQYYVLADDDPD